MGYTTQAVAQRVAEQYPVLLPTVSYTIELNELALRDDGSYFTDHDVHRVLARKGVKRLEGEWFACSLKAVKAALLELKTGKPVEDARTQRFGARPEQQAAVDKAAAYFRSAVAERPAHTPHFLWNAKMRFGKTFATYQLARTMGWSKLLVMTFKPAVQDAWADDLANHVDFADWQFVTNKGMEQAGKSFDTVRREQAAANKPLVCFGSFQDFLGKSNAGGIKAHNDWVHTTHWDCVVFDEYHYGAWRETAKDLFAAEDKKEIDFGTGDGEGLSYFDEDAMPVTTGAYLYLSGTPFRAISSGEFIEEQIYNWTYSDEQRAKSTWAARVVDANKSGSNPYAALPRMVMLTYQLPDNIRNIAMGGEFNEFDLNTFFTAEINKQGDHKKALFKYAAEVQKWLDLIRGSLAESVVDTLKLGAEKPPMPFSDIRLLNALSHTFWFLPSVAACHAMANLLKQKQNKFYQDYTVVVAAGSDAGIGVAALPPVKAALGDGLSTKSITLSCGKLTTGVSVAPWTGIFMLRNVTSPETYFQAAFRVQTPWVVRSSSIDATLADEIVKHECYVFDFAPDRALRQIADYSCRLNVDESNPESKVAEFIRFLPVLAYDGSSMKQIDAAGVLDMAMSGTTATLLARRWESALLVNVDNATLQRLMDNAAAMTALANIEGFRNLNAEIETIINKSNAVKQAKKDAGDEKLSKKDKQAISDEEKEYKSLRKQIQDKLIKFATRVPVFMYLTDYREHSLKDVITQLEPDLFKKVTGLTQADFELLMSLNVFNNALMNDAVYKFKRYEDASLEYTGLNRHGGNAAAGVGAVGLYDTVLSAQDYLHLKQV